jgi:acetoin utilization deacetylase AcuC-like enzyme
MNALGFIYHPDYLNHDTGIGHPERKQRLETLVQHLLGTPLWNKMSHLRPSPAPLEWVHKVHPERYTSMIKSRCLNGEQVLDAGDTHACKDSYDIALLAAGGVLQAVDEILSGNLKNVFCAVRPPGHHAETSAVMGFCLLNNIAIGARYAQQKYGVGRVAILDWDVHHGNGTQEIFYRDDTVLYISLHQYPFYPGTGAASERGAGKGEGFTLNCPMSAGSTEKEYLVAFREQIIPSLHKFQPELFMISAGFDAHKDDPLANINLTEESFAAMTEMAIEISAKYCNGRIISVLEGGYNLQALAKSVEAHLGKLV